MVVQKVYETALPHVFQRHDGVLSLLVSHFFTGIYIHLSLSLSLLVLSSLITFPSSDVSIAEAPGRVIFFSTSRFTLLPVDPDCICRSTTPRGDVYSLPLRTPNFQRNPSVRLRKTCRNSWYIVFIYIEIYSRGLLTISECDVDPHGSSGVTLGVCNSQATHKIHIKYIYLRYL